MKKIDIKKMVYWFCALLVLLTIAATSKQIMGPTDPVTANAVIRWRGTSGWQATNSLMIIDDSGNATGLISLTMDTFNIGTGVVTNGVQYLQQASAPTASDVGGTVGSVTNHLIRNVNGQLIDYWADGTTLNSKTLAP
jgi:hypothetical protein